MGNDVRTLSIDIGGSGIKMFVLDERGEPLTERVRRPTPGNPTPEAVLQELNLLIGGQGDFDRVSVGFPGVVCAGEVRSAVNLDPSWIGFNLAEALAKASGKPTRVANDADVQGMAVIEGQGVELVLTLGTGLGSALFTNGHLMPNLEMGHHPFRKGRTYEEYLGAAGLEEKGKKKWNAYLQEAMENLERLFNYRLLYLGGGNAKKVELDLPPNARIVPNVAGLLGGIALWRD
jgi:polyphosphate glucokinase